jgi:Fe-S-cluster containining protein
LSPSDIDCTTCGACCFGTHDHYIALMPEDRARAIPANLTNDSDGRRFMKMCEGHCAQLARTDDARLVCGIYDIRPEACRAFRAGSFECMKARQHRGALAEALRNPAPIRPKIIEPETELPPAHVIAILPKGRMKPPA